METLQEDFGIVSLRLFGSTAVGKHGQNSDVDVFVDTKTPNPFLLMQAKEYLEEKTGCPVDIEEAETRASEDVVAQREEALAKQLAEMKRRKRKLVDPLQFEMSIQAEDLTGYVPSFGWEMGPPTDRQKKTLEKLGIMPDEVECCGKAAKILDRLSKRRTAGLTTPKQIRSNRC